MTGLSAILLLSWIFASIDLPTNSWLPTAYIVEAEKYYDALDADQWDDIYWHDKHHGIRNAVFAGMEGSNRSRGKHGEENSFQDTGIFYGTARLFRSHEGLLDSLKSHSFAAQLSADIDSSNLEMEYRRKSLRPVLNATMRYPGGSKWRGRLVYGMVFTARHQVLEKRLRRP